MNHKERKLISFVLLLVLILVGFDLITDAREGAVNWHLLIEAGVGASALYGLFRILRSSMDLRHQLQAEIQNFSDFKKEAEVWRANSRKYVEGLSEAIDNQLEKWKLSTSEKEVAFLLLKGLSLKEIAEIRQTTEKTARVQSMAIYSKSGLAGRSELSAFFLEDLLVPQHSTDDKISKVLVDLKENA